MFKLELPRKQLLERLTPERWVQDAWYGEGEKACLHGHLRQCSPVPGDAHIWEAVTNRMGVGSVTWQDQKGRSLSEVREWVATVEITDADLELTFGPQWLPVIGIIRREAVLTPEESEALEAAWYADRGAAWYAAWGAAWNAAVIVARGAARGVAGGAALAVVTYDLIGQYGYTEAHADVLLAPWRGVIGDPFAYRGETFTTVGS